MDRSVEEGIDFFDTAEVYPVPPDISYVHRSEEIVGRWLKDKDRDSIVIATKFCGASNSWFVPPVRTGRTAVDAHNIRKAVEGSLRRLQTDYIDLYQTHWPDHDFPFEHTLEALTDLIRQGKVRYLGSSNESAWGAMKAQAVADANGSRMLWPKSAKRNRSAFSPTRQSAAVYSAENTTAMKCHQALASPTIRTVANGNK
jgi:aryl-alcohol dehydrogenase-like predicted oxidoreductase